MYQLNCFSDSNNIGYRDCYVIDRITNEIQVDNLRYIHKFLDYYRDLYYNNLEVVSDDVIWLAMLTAVFLRN